MTLPMYLGSVSVVGAAAGVGSALAAGALAWGAVAPGSQLFGPTIRRTGNPRTIALTFDDGPNPHATPRLLRLLEAHGVRATFFLIGGFVRACPGLVAEIAARGHVIGNHTDTHPSLLMLSPRRIADELSRCQDAIESACRLRPVWMRPPFGFRGPQLSAVVRGAGFRGVVMWSRWAWDWKPQPLTRTIARLRPVCGGDIVVLHDGDYRHLGADRHPTVAALEHCLPLWRDAGFQFVTLDHLAPAKSLSPTPAPADVHASQRSPSDPAQGQPAGEKTRD